MKKQTAFQSNCVPAINIQLRELFMYACECSYDIIRGDPNCGLITLKEITEGCTNPDKLREAFKTGYTPCMMGNHMSLIESYDENKNPYVIIVRDNDTIFAIITSEDVSY